MLRSLKKEVYLEIQCTSTRTNLVCNIMLQFDTFILTRKSIHRPRAKRVVLCRHNDSEGVPAVPRPAAAAASSGRRHHHTELLQEIQTGPIPIYLQYISNKYDLLYTSCHY